MATVKLFKLILSKDVEKTIITNTVRIDPKKQIDNKLLRLIEDAPTAAGVYYMHREDGTIMYIGKSKNIKKRLNQHFTGDNRKSRKMQIEVYSVSFEITGSELIALLKENQEIKTNKPKYNRALRRTKFDQALYQFIDSNGFINLKVEKANHRKKNITTFSNKQQAKSFMHRWIEEYHLCQKLMGLDTSQGNCFNYTIKQCNGACIQKESSEEYNTRVKQLIYKHKSSNTPS